MFPIVESRDTAFFEALKDGDRIEMIGAWSGLVRFIFLEFL